MVVLMENGSSREAKDDSSTSVNVHQFQAAFHSQARISMKQSDHDHNRQRPTSGNGGDEVFKREMRELEELFSKLNPMAREFVPPSFANTIMPMKIKLDGGYSAKSTAAADVMHLNGFSNNDGNMGRRGKNGHHQAKRRTNSRTSMAQREEVIRRTVYVSDVDHQITEEHLAALFLGCGQVVDCRICGDPNSVLRFAFVEFTDEEAAHAALNLSGTMLGYYPVKTLDEREMCSRTVYVTNIDKKVCQTDVKLFFETICGKVYRLRLLGDYHHSSRIAFVEFAVAESAIAALNCSGVVLGMLPIRVSPSKTPVRPRTPRPPSQ
ncbi:Polyadenylate-binding protein-interacting protein 11 [Sesamum angolense]|uniref:Polyadenylate-binding protein-interacting protein 11 n=1 Tax=Sesamum angolense TaxID=2727404 RepID=A0AAE1WAB8_9LAMI|nr:Polyadenylate-binding protein-interacting protein 11 [Sesamum angolense]